LFFLFRIQKRFIFVAQYFKIFKKPSTQSAISPKRFYFIKIYQNIFSKNTYKMLDILGGAFLPSFLSKKKYFNEMKKQIFYLTIALVLLTHFSALAQMPRTVGDTLWGNEWLRTVQSYVKFKIGSDGMYRISGTTLQSAGVPVGSITGANLQIWRMGSEIPIFVSTNATFGTSDFVEFYGERHRAELDSFFYPNRRRDVFNTEYSNITDTMTYFVTWTGTATQRVSSLANDLTNLPTREAYCFSRLRQRRADASLKYSFGDAIYTSTFASTEGFGSKFLPTIDETFNLPELYPNINGELLVRWQNQRIENQYFTSIRVNGNVIFTDSVFVNGLTRQRALVVQSTNLRATTTLNLQNQLPNRLHSLAWAEFKYPRTFNFQNQSQLTFFINGSGGARYFEIDNFNHGGVAPILYDATNKIRLVTTVDNGKVKFKLPASVLERKLILMAQSAGYTEVTNLKNILIDNLSTDAGNYVILTSQRFIADGSANAYANYRRSAAGGSYRVKVVDVEQVYDQFGYGVERHPISVRNFANFVARTWANPRYLLLIGKAREYRYCRTADEVNSADNAGFDVPTYGYPASDNLMVAYPNSFEVSIPVGRIAATTAGDLRTYLEKVRLLEQNQQLAAQNIAERDWQKHGLHLSGGGSAAGLKNSLMGAKMTTVAKTSNDPIQVSQDETIFRRINDGASLISFFGHSAGSTLEYSVDDRDRLRNDGKNALFVALGCEAGNLATPEKGVAENMIFFPNRGSVAFLATSGRSELTALGNTGDSLYRHLGNDQLGNGIGNAIRRTTKDFARADIVTYQSVIQQLTLNGDPAIKLFVAQGTDYLVDATTVKFAPQNLTTQLDSFTVSFDVVNIGRNRQDSMMLQVRQELPNGAMLELKRLKIATPQYRQRFSFKLPSQGKRASGQNRIHVRVDADNNIAELPAAAEMNNDLVSSNGALGVPFYLFDINATPMYPLDFSIVGQQPLALRASTSNSFAPSGGYVFEFDTSANFNTNFKIQQRIVQTGGVVRWTIPTTLRNNTVYYWRISPDSIAGAGYIWESRSFLFQQGAPNEGYSWNQSHAYQYLKDSTNSLGFSVDNNQWEFSNDFQELSLKNTANVINADLTPLYYFRNEVYEAWFPGDDGGLNTGGVMIMLLDGTNAAYYNYIATERPYGSDWLPGMVPGNRPRNALYFRTDNINERREVINFLRDSIPNGTYVSVLTVQKLNTSFFPEQWTGDSATLGTNIFRLLEQQGAQQVRRLATTGSRPYSLIYRQNNGPIGEKLADSLREFTTLTRQIAVKWDTGYVVSTTVGPVSAWRDVTFQTSPAAAGIRQNFAVSVFGTKSNGEIDTIALRTRTSPISLTGVDPTTKLRLRFETRDTIYRKPTQLDFWRIGYEPFQEVALNPSAQLVIRDTTMQGENLPVRATVENLGIRPVSDSLDFKFTITDINNRDSVINLKIRPLARLGDTAVAQLNLPTRNILGRYRVAMEVNPAKTLPEMVYLNNYGQRDFVVQRDVLNPLLDVTFDGQRILNGDLISATPSIAMQLKDENKFLLLADTNSFRITVKYPNEATERMLFFSDPNLRFTPATNVNDNKAKVEWNPKFVADGVYNMSIRAKDATGNISGATEYKIDFQVITKSSISNLLPYPNPFSTACRFAYTLTGSEPPKQFKIQIFSMSGRVVREISQNEIGDLKIGKHLTEYVWDGTDEFGDKLAVGVYLYRVLAKKADGSDYESYENGTSEYFKNGFGKIVLIK
jgi:hypothetical protein